MTTIRTKLSEESWVDQLRLPDMKYDFDELWNAHPEEFGLVKIFGRLVRTPRWQQSYLQGYNFSGMFHKAEPLPEVFQPFFDWANSLGYGKFTQVLVNWYQDGHHYIGAHSDSERQLVKNSPIVSISLGCTRKFRIRNKKGIVKDIAMDSDTAIVMGGHFQQEFKHEVPKIGGKKGAKVGSRINITFRIFKE